MLQVESERMKGGEEIFAVGIADGFLESRMKRRGVQESFKKTKSRPLRVRLFAKKLDRPVSASAAPGGRA